MARKAIASTVEKDPDSNVLEPEQYDALKTTCHEKTRVPMQVYLREGLDHVLDKYRRIAKMITAVREGQQPRSHLRARQHRGADQFCDQQVKECTEPRQATRFQVAEVFKDDGISGTRRDRPGLFAAVGSGGCQRVRHTDTLEARAAWARERGSGAPFRHLEFRGLR